MVKSANPNIARAVEVLLDACRDLQPGDRITYGEMNQLIDVKMPHAYLIKRVRAILQREDIYFRVDKGLTRFVPGDHERESRRQYLSVARKARTQLRMLKAAPIMQLSAEERQRIVVAKGTWAVILELVEAEYKQEQRAAQHARQAAKETVILLNYQMDTGEQPQPSPPPMQ